jgi:formylglycine-generating enzyme required for sulfatase activity
MNYKELTGKKNPFEGLSSDEKRRLIVYFGYVAVPSVPMDEIKRRWGAVLNDDEIPTTFEALEMVEIIKREVLAEENVEKEACNKSGCFAGLVFGLLCVATGIAIGIAAAAFPYVQQIFPPTKLQPRKTPMPPKTGQTTTITLPGGEKMEMIYCGPGTFLMGSPVSESGRDADETQHRVTLTKGFWLGKYKVTQAQWESVMGANPSSEKGFDRPVEGVSWSECFLFAQKIDAKLNCGVRMPSEAEWEYACRAGGKTEYSSDTDVPDAVGENAWGFVSMRTGAMEWCLDEYIGDYSTCSVTDTQVVKRSANDVNATFILRGGTRVIKRGGYYDNRDKYSASRPADRMHSVAHKKKTYYHFAKVELDGSGGGFYSDSAKHKYYSDNYRIDDFPFGFRLCCSQLPDK